MRTRSALTRFANNEIHQNVAEEDTRRQRALRGRTARRGGLAQPRTTMAALARLAAAAAATARLQPEQSRLPLPARATADHPGGGGVRRAAPRTPTRRSAREAAAAVIAAAEAVGAQAFGYVQTGSEEVSVANSLGVRVSEPRSRAQVLTVMMGPGGGSGYAEQVAVDLDTIDASAIGHEAAAAHGGHARPHRDCRPGDYPVVLESYAVMDFTDWLGYLGFSALAVQEERSFYEPGKGGRPRRW